MTGPAASRSSSPRDFRDAFLGAFLAGMTGTIHECFGPGAPRIQSLLDAGGQRGVGGEIAAPEVDRQQRRGAGAGGVTRVRRVMDQRAGRLLPPRPVVAPPLAVPRQRVVDLDGGVRMQR